MKPLKPEQIDIPRFRISKKAKQTNPDDVTLFNLSSHARAREAMSFGLKMRHLNFHVYVVGEDRSGRMTATIAFLNQFVKNFPPPPDWVYLNNFLHPHRPKPFKLPAGKGAELRDNMRDMIESIRSLLTKTFTDPAFVSQIDAMKASLEKQIRDEVEHIQEAAERGGVEIDQGPQGFLIRAKGGEENSQTTKHIEIIRDRLSRISTSAHIANRQLMQDIKRVKAAIADHAISPLLNRFSEKYAHYLDDWIQDFRQDLLNNIDTLIDEGAEHDAQISQNMEERYAINLLIDNRHIPHPKVILESNPTYENLFGSIKYRATPMGGVETNFTMIRPGALHLANGGILVLRADALAKDPDVWDMLKAALRDRHIRTEELHREHALPLMDAPAPKPIPLDLQVFLIGAPAWFYHFFYADPDFHSHFKVKVDIEPDLPAAQSNIDFYALLIYQTAEKLTGMSICDEAASYLIGYSARWVGHRKKISARFELIGDVIGEASVFARERQDHIIHQSDVCKALLERRLRNARHEDRGHEDIELGLVRIETSGKAIGEINGLAVFGTLDHHYGLPSRITARTYMGEEGVINIERLTDMGGPIQQKGALILDGFLNGLFAQDFPVAFNCSLTFEQNYSEVEGDSASLAELLAILSSLAEIPLRQDIAVTGSLDQIGRVQAVGGVIHKIEGFYHLCKFRGLSGTQGVIIPKSNVQHVILRGEVVEAVRQKKFFIWPVETLENAIQLMMNRKAGHKIKKGFSKGSLFEAVYEKLHHYHKNRHKDNRKF